MAVVALRKRLGIFGSLAIVMLCLVTVRTWFLQVVDAEGLQERVQEVRTRTVQLLPERGRIFDSVGRIVADNERVLTVTIDRSVIVDAGDTAQLFLLISVPLQTPFAEL